MGTHSWNRVLNHHDTASGAGQLSDQRVRATVYALIDQANSGVLVNVAAADYIEWLLCLPAAIALTLARLEYKGLIRLTDTEKVSGERVSLAVTRVHGLLRLGITSAMLSNNRLAKAIDYFSQGDSTS